MLDKHKSYNILYTFDLREVFIFVEYVFSLFLPFIRYFELLIEDVT